LRYLIAIGAATVLSLAGIASAQNSTPRPGQAPGKTSLPTKPLYRGGFQRPIFRGGFPRIMPDVRLVPTTNDPQAAPAPSSSPTQILDDNDLLPSELQREADADLRLNSPGAPATVPAHTHDEAGECTGACANLPDHHHDAKAEAKEPTTANPKVNDLLAKIRPPDKPAPAAPTFDQAAFDRANKPGAGSAASCVACHTDKSKFFRRPPSATPDTPRPGPSAKELAREFRQRPDTRVMNVQDRGLSMPPAAAPSTWHEPMDKDNSSNSDLVGRAPGTAVEPLRDHLKDQPDDFHAMRQLALALLGSKHAQEAADMMAKAYESDPLLSKEPIDLKPLGIDAPRLNNLIRAASDAARQSNSSKSWLLAVVLYQAQGSQSQAISALDKARHAGLNSDVSDWFTEALKRKPERVADAK
jgi:hypothetical protein